MYGFYKLYLLHILKNTFQKPYTTLHTIHSLIFIYLNSGRWLSTPPLQFFIIIIVYYIYGTLYTHGVSVDFYISQKVYLYGYT